MTNDKKEQLGLVIAHYGKRITIETAEGEQLQCHLRRNQALPVVGDNVLFYPDGQETGVVVDIEPRHSILQRGDDLGREKPLAANVDLLLIVMAPPPIFSAELVDRYTVAAELLKITPLLVINKIDLLTDREQDDFRQSLKQYDSIGYQVIFASCILQHGLGALLHALRGKRAVFAGPSGVGKSSIIKELAPLDTIQIGEVSAKGIGKHTTTATRLYHLPDGGELIDSPGLRDFKLWSIGESQVFQGFKELHGHTTCRFRDCAHLAEPDCGVRLSVNAGKISLARYEHYCKWRYEIRKSVGKEK